MKSMETKTSEKSPREAFTVETPFGIFAASPNNKNEMFENPMLTRTSAISSLDSAKQRLLDNKFPLADLPHGSSEHDSLWKELSEMLRLSRPEYFALRKYVLAQEQQQSLTKLPAASQQNLNASDKHVQSTLPTKPAQPVISEQQFELPIKLKGDKAKIAALEKKFTALKMGLQNIKGNTDDHDDDESTVWSESVIPEDSESELSDGDASSKLSHRVSKLAHKHSDKSLARKYSEVVRRLEYFYSSDPFDLDFLSILAAAVSPNGIELLTVTRAVYSTTIEKSFIGSSKEKNWVNKQLYGPPGSLKISTGLGFRKGTPDHVQVGFPRTVKQCLDLVASQEEMLMHKQCTFAQEIKDSWLRALQQFRRDLNTKLNRLFGHNPDSKGPQHLRKRAGICTFVFTSLQRAFAAQEPQLLHKQFQERFDQLVTDLVKSTFGESITVQEYEAMNIVMGYSCTKPGCLQPGQTPLKCGVCEKPAAAVSNVSSTSQFKAAKAAAKIIFDALPTTLAIPQERAKYDAFVKAHPQWIWKPTDTGISSSVAVSSKATGLKYILANEEKIELPFSLA